MRFFTLIFIAAVGGCSPRTTRVQTSPGSNDETYGSRPNAAECRAGKGWACNDLGVYWFERHQQEKTGAWSPNAEPYFERACKLGEQTGCANLEILRLHEALLKRQQAAAALRQLELLCSQGRAPACFLAGAALLPLPTGGAPYAWTNYRLAPNPGRAFPLFQRACKLGAGDGCFAMALALHRRNGVSGVALQVPEQNWDVYARELEESACANGTAIACNEVGLYLARSEPREWTKAARALQTACKSGGVSSSCITLAVASETTEHASQPAAERPDFEYLLLHARGIGQNDAARDPDARYKPTANSPRQTMLARLAQHCVQDDRSGCPNLHAWELLQECDAGKNWACASFQALPSTLQRLHERPPLED